MTSLARLKKRLLARALLFAWRKLSRTAWYREEHSRGFLIGRDGVQELWDALSHELRMDRGGALLVTLEELISFPADAREVLRMLIWSDAVGPTTVLEELTRDLLEAEARGG